MFRRSPKTLVATLITLLAFLSAGDVLYGQAKGDALFIDSSGRVGIGTTAPRGKLDIQAGANAGGTNDGQALAFSWHGGGFRHWLRTRHNGTIGSGNAFDIYVNDATTPEGSTGPGSGSLHVMTLDSGNVGIGKTDPKARLDVAGTVIAGAYEGHGAVPKGAILMWSGDPGKLPSGWVLCNGQGGTPDLSSRFIVGYDPRDTLYNYAKTRNTGGEAKHALTQDEMGNHTHTVKSVGKAVGSHRHQYIGFGTTEASANVDVYGSGTEGVTKTSDPVPHENRPPYMVLAFIMYVGASQ